MSEIEKPSAGSDQKVLNESYNESYGKGDILELTDGTFVKVERAKPVQGDGNSFILFEVQVLDSDMKPIRGKHKIIGAAHIAGKLDN